MKINELFEAKTNTKPWAEEMLKVIKSVAGGEDVTKKIVGIRGSEGTEISSALGKSIIAAFKKDKWQPFEQIKKFYVIESKEDEEVGISIDFRSDMGIESGKCIIMFFSDK